jgi:hypothetical protein
MMLSLYIDLELFCGVIFRGVKFTLKRGAAPQRPAHGSHARTAPLKKTEVTTPTSCQHLGV